MNTIEIIKTLCKTKGISISALEKDLGYGNGSLSKARVIPSDRVYEIATYFNVSMEYLMTGIDSNGLSEADNRDIAKDLEDIMKKLDSGEDGPIRYNGQAIDDTSRILLRNAIELGLTQLKIENKKLYNPNKNKK